MKTSYGKVWNVIIFADAFRILPQRRKEEKILFKVLTSIKNLRGSSANTP